MTRRDPFSSLCASTKQGESKNRRDCSRATSLCTTASCSRCEGQPIAINSSEDQVRSSQDQGAARVHRSDLDSALQRLENSSVHLAKLPSQLPVSQLARTFTKVPCTLTEAPDSAPSVHAILHHAIQLVNWHRVWLHEDDQRTGPRGRLGIRRHKSTKTVAHSPIQEGLDHVGDLRSTSEDNDAMCTDDEDVVPVPNFVDEIEGAEPEPLMFAIEL